MPSSAHTPTAGPVRSPRDRSGRSPRPAGRLKTVYTKGPSPWLIVLPVVLLALLASFLIAVNASVLVAAFFGGITLVPLLYFVNRNFSDRSGWLMWVGWLLMLVASGVSYSTKVPIGYVQELLIFGLVLVIVQAVGRGMARDVALRTAALLWLGYLCLCLLSSWWGRSHTLPALWQLQYNLKWPLMFGLGLLLAWGERPALQLRRLAKYSWLLLGACVALEIAAPGAHKLLFGPPADLHTNPLLGVGLRYRGPLTHSGHLALASALMVCVSVAQWLSGRSRKWLLIALPYLVLALLSGQRQELFAMVLGLGAMVVIHWWRLWFLWLGLAILLGALAALAMAATGYVPMRETLEQFNILPSMAALSERAVLSVNGFDIAAQHFPLGSGLGTYGGVGAQKFDQSLFLERGFMQYWWFRQGLFLVDTFWPSIVAESGYFGALLLLLVLAVLWITTFVRAIRHRMQPHYVVCLSAVGALTLLLGNSPSSSALTDPRSAFLFWLLVGAAWRACMPAGRPAPRHYPIHPSTTP